MAEYTLQELATRTGLTRRAITYRVAGGSIHRLDNGKFDDQALETLLEAAVKAVAAAAKAAEMRQARAKAGHARLVALTDKLAVLEASTVEREAVQKMVLADAAVVTRHVRRLGSTAATIAKDLEIDLHQARELMKHVGKLAVAELGNIGSELEKLLTRHR
jgi:hypothetical protein